MPIQDDEKSIEEAFKRYGFGDVKFSWHRPGFLALNYGSIPQAGKSEEIIIFIRDYLGVSCVNRRYFERKQIIEKLNSFEERLSDPNTAIEILIDMQKNYQKYDPRVINLLLDRHDPKVLLKGINFEGRKQYSLMGLMVINRDLRIFERFIRAGARLSVEDLEHDYLRDTNPDIKEFHDLNSISAGPVAHHPVTNFTAAYKKTQESGAPEQEANRVLGQNATATVRNTESDPFAVLTNLTERAFPGFKSSAPKKSDDISKPSSVAKVASSRDRGDSKIAKETYPPQSNKPKTDNQSSIDHMIERQLVFGTFNKDLKTKEQDKKNGQDKDKTSKPK